MSQLGFPSVVAAGFRYEYIVQGRELGLTRLVGQKTSRPKTARETGFRGEGGAGVAEEVSGVGVNKCSSHIAQHTWRASMETSSSSLAKSESGQPPSPSRSRLPP